MLARAIYGVMTKVLSSKVTYSAATQGFLLALCAAILSAIVSPALGGIAFVTTTKAIILSIIIIITTGLGNILYFKAIRFLTSGTAQISFSTILIFNTFLSVLLLNTHLTLINWLGIFVLGTAILLVIGGKVEYHKVGVPLMILSALVFSGFQLSSSEISKIVSAGTYTFLSYIGAAFTILIFQFKDVRDDFKRIKDMKIAITIPFLTALPSIANYVLAYFAYRSAPDGPKVAMLLTAQVVVAVLLSYIFLKERQNLLKKIIAGVLVFVSAILIKS